MTPSEQWDRTVGLHLSEPWHDDDKAFGVSAFVGLVSRPHRLFCPGDLVIGRYSNGGGTRQPVTSYTSKGRRVIDLYLAYSKSYYEEIRYRPGPRHRSTRHVSHGALRGPLEIFDLTPFFETPGRSARENVSWTDPAFRGFVLDLHARRLPHVR